MRKLLPLAAALCLAGLPAARAQSLGVKGGFSYGNVSNSGFLPGDLGGRTGFTAGFALSPRGVLGFGGEALYAQRGVTSSTVTDSRSLDYLDVPVYARVSVPAPGLAPFAYAGPMLSYEIRCRSGGGSCPDTGRPRTSYAGVIGGGAALGGPGSVSIEGRYVYGLTDLKLSTITNAQSYRTRSFAILAEIPF